MIDFIPIILGSDENAYGCARMFYSISKTKPVLLCSRALLPTEHSGILLRRVVPDLDSPAVFTKVLKETLSVFKNEYKKILVVPCSDYYAELLIKNAEKFNGMIDSPIISADLYSKFSTKGAFCDLCKKHALPHPQTEIALPSALLSVTASFEYPVVMKPSNSNCAEYLHSSIPDRKKAYVCQTEAELKKALESFVIGGFNSPVVVQKYIKGDESGCRVINAYCDKDSKVRLIGAAMPLLEYKNGTDIGNYVALRPVSERELCDKAADFLEAIGYKGFANFDIKFDPERGEHVFLELNPRQGRSSYYMNTAGENLMLPLYEECVLGKGFTNRRYAEGDGVWINEPTNRIKREMRERGLSGSELLDKFVPDSALSLTFDFNLPRAITLIRRSLGAYSREL